MSGWTVLTILSDNPEELATAHDEKGLSGDLDIVDERVRILFDGYGNHAKAVRVMDELEAFVKQAVVIDANDTTDSGEGVLYTHRDMILKDGSYGFFVSDRKVGKQPERGQDVANYFEENYGFRPFVEWWC